MPFGGTLDPDNRWVLLAELIPCQELEEAYAPQFSANLDAPAKPVRLAFGSLYSKQRLGLTDEETVLQIQENPYMQFFLGFSAYSSKVPFDPSMMVHFRKRVLDEDLRHINELVVQRGKEMLIEAAAAQAHDETIQVGMIKTTAISSRSIAWSNPQTGQKGRIGARSALMPYA